MDVWLRPHDYGIRLCKICTWVLFRRVWSCLHKCGRHTYKKIALEIIQHRCDYIHIDVGGSQI